MTSPVKPAIDPTGTTHRKCIALDYITNARTKEWRGLSHLRTSNGSHFTESFCELNSPVYTGGRIRRGTRTQVRGATNSAEWAAISIGLPAPASRISLLHARPTPSFATPVQYTPCTEELNNGDELLKLYSCFDDAADLLKIYSNFCLILFKTFGKEYVLWEFETLSNVF